MLAGASLLLLLAQPFGAAPALPGPDEPPTAGVGEPAPGPQMSPTHKRLLGHVGQDFRHLVDHGNLWILGSGALASLAVHPADRALTNDFRRSRFLDRFFGIGDFVGGMGQLGGALGTYAVGRVTHKGEVSSLGGDLLRAQFTSGMVVQGLKLVVRRTRPNGLTRRSFPSGHASASFATATVLQRHYGRAVGIPAYLLASYVAGSRLQDNKHFPSDVLAGATLGIMAGRSVTFGRVRAPVALVPLVASGGGWGLALVSAH